jgi:hypothetical protein
MKRIIKNRNYTFFLLLVVSGANSQKDNSSRIQGVKRTGSATLDVTSSTRMALPVSACEAKETT